MVLSWEEEKNKPNQSSFSPMPFLLSVFFCESLSTSFILTWWWIASLFQWEGVGIDRYSFFLDLSFLICSSSLMFGFKCVGQGRAAACLLKFPGRHCWKWCFLWIIFVFIWFDLNLGALHKEKQATVRQELVGKMKWKWHWQEHYRKTHHSVTGFTEWVWKCSTRTTNGGSSTACKSKWMMQRSQKNIFS